MRLELTESEVRRLYQVIRTQHDRTLAGLLARLEQYLYQSLTIEEIERLQNGSGEET